jgi:hypothetical protein
LGDAAVTAGIQRCVRVSVASSWPPVFFMAACFSLVGFPSCLLCNFPSVFSSGDEIGVGCVEI